MRFAGFLTAMLLYIHIPFCRKKCAYCAFYSRPLKKDATGAAAVAAYLATLREEIRFWGERLAGEPIETVFLGGGTPSLLPAKAIGGLLEDLDRFFSLSSGAEITVEANPESALADGWLFAVKAAGANRLSLGVQSFDDHALRLLGRGHSSRVAEAACATARAAGFANISLDFMWGLPGPPGRSQSQRAWLAQLRKAVALQPEHISAYGLTLEAGSPLAAECASGRLVLPAEPALASMYLAGADFLESRGYRQYEISNFARAGFSCRHNVGYWEGKEYLGLGPAATSTLRGKRWTNPESGERWERAVREGKCGDAAEQLDASIGMKELLMLRLRMNRGLPLDAWRRLRGSSFLDDFASLAALLQQRGLACTRNGFFRLTRRGMLVSDLILASFFERMESGVPAPSRSAEQAIPVPDTI